MEGSHHFALGIKGDFSQAGTPGAGVFIFQSRFSSGNHQRALGWVADDAVTFFRFFQPGITVQQASVKDQGQALIIPGYHFITVLP
ncbi:MAG: hypothetical protein BWY65_01624 [Firmicutes bacterium ADurb.Bin373]|nr:MAG: hypothetical protein BWY65_01624 [Firmicutes bacterium ADurb.Bin373]